MARVQRQGFTLVEVIVVVAIVGLIAGVSGLAFTSLRAPRASARVRALRTARTAAIASGRPAAVRDSNGPVLFLPDGRGIGPGVDPLTGTPRDAP